MQGRLILGVDGGGTHCRVRIKTWDGRLMAEAEGGSANVNQDQHQALRNIMQTVRLAAQNCGLTEADFGQIHAGMGLAGVTSRQMAADIEQADWPFARIYVDDDAYIACLGAHGGADGGIVITGTGSAAVCLVNGVRFAVGGRGFALGDEGSGAVLGRDALRAALRTLDGLAPATALTEALLHHFHHDAGAMARWGVTATPQDYARFAPMVFHAAQEGDTTGLSLVAACARALDELARRLLAFGAPKLCLIGGLAQAVRPYLAPDIAQTLAEPEADALEGAILMAMQQESQNS